jgi:hypothetical protein
MTPRAGDLVVYRTDTQSGRPVIGCVIYVEEPGPDGRVGVRTPSGLRATMLTSSLRAPTGEELLTVDPGFWP